MTEYIAQCRHDEDQYLKAHHNRMSVILDGYASGENVTSPYVSPGAARTFARGILALADEIDGGVVPEAPEPAVTAKWGAIKPGGKVRILIDDAECADVSAGDVFTVHAVDERLVTVDDEANGGHWYFRDTTSIELVDEPAPADEPARPLKVGDKVRITRNGMTYQGDENVGRVGELTAIDAYDAKQPYEVHIEGSYRWWCAEVELVDEPAPADEPAPVFSIHAALIRNAKTLLADTEHTAADLIRLAEFLAAE